MHWLISMLPGHKMRAFGYLCGFVCIGLVLLVSLTLLVARFAEQLPLSFTGVVLAEQVGYDAELVIEINRLRGQVGSHAGATGYNYTSGIFADLTEQSRPDNFYQVSPDGRYAAFVSYRDGNAEVYVLAIASGFLRNISTNPGTDALPVWSPDSRLLAFSSNRNGTQSLYLADVERGLTRKLIPHLTFGTVVEWLPDSSIQFRAYRGGKWTTQRVEW